MVRILLLLIMSSFCFGQDVINSMAMGVTGARDNLMKDSLKAYWSLDESSGNASDATGRGNTLTNTNSATYVSGLKGNAVRVDSSLNSYLTMASTTDVAGGDADWCVAVWFQKKLTGTGDNYGENILAKYTPTREYNFIYTSNTTITAKTWDGTTEAGSLAKTITSDTTTFHLFILWHTGDSTYFQYDGGVYTADIDAVPPTAGAGAFRLGDNGATAGRTTGLIDEVAFWKRTLTLAERTWLFNSGNGRAYSEFK